MNSRDPILAVFDIDGTLTETNAVDDECYCTAIGESLGLAAAEVDWAEAPHVTDAAIAGWLWQKHRGCTPTTSDLARVRERFMELLTLAGAAAPHRFAAVRGARDVLSRLRDHGWEVALATGGWGSSARLKLRFAEVAHPGVALACADDAVTREDIVRLATARAETVAGRQFTRVVSVGDGVWDVRTACSLGLPFVGIGTGGRALRLREAGASTVLADLENWADLTDALRRATVPRQRQPGETA